jgi:hypothetical protein
MSSHGSGRYAQTLRGGLGVEVGEDSQSNDLTLSYRQAAYRGQKIYVDQIGELLGEGQVVIGQWELPPPAPPPGHPRV